jgi:hypothetical protein
MDALYSKHHFVSILQIVLFAYYLHDIPGIISSGGICPFSVTINECSSKLDQVCEGCHQTLHAAVSEIYLKDLIALVQYYGRYLANAEFLVYDLISHLVIRSGSLPPPESEASAISAEYSFTRAGHYARAGSCSSQAATVPATVPEFPAVLLPDALDTPKPPAIPKPSVSKDASEPLCRPVKLIRNSHLFAGCLYKLLRESHP